MTKLENLIIASHNIVPTEQEKEEQRRSFAYGNTKVENPHITREIIDREAEGLRLHSK